MTSIDVKVAEELRELYEEVHRSTEMNLGLLHRAYHRGYLAGIRDAEPILEQRKRNAEEMQKQNPD